MHSILPRELQRVLAVHLWNRFSDKYTHSQISLVFTDDSSESLVYDLLQLNVLHTGRFMFQLTQPPSSVNLIFYLKPNCTKVAKYNQLQTNLVFRDSPGTQLNLSFVMFPGD
ncbi:hypothetical protein CSKR_113615 [Clonorchis sinensis]|uniref:Uncharacterized protein n=1 Tax=Clonorchis sinensis TaxID=79923 RepID=A0A419QDZ3_CLOSI|nr:hypothetical protein CSKR_113615 [Clonorchis sinensis]